MFICECLCVGMHMYIQVPIESKVYKPLGAGVLSIHSLTNGGAENQIQVLSRSSEHGQMLSHLCSPTSAF